VATKDQQRDQETFMTRFIPAQKIRKSSWDIIKLFSNGNNNAGSSHENMDLIYKTTKDEIMEHNGCVHGEP
jgi:hypothetical protein